MNQEVPKAKLRRGIYLLPNLFTVSALFAGFYAIIAATQHRFELAAIWIFVAMLLDGLDGRVARLTHTQSEFGAQFDSMSDMVCFGITPALVVYIWSLHAMGKPGWIACFLYAVCTALRLARFNSQSQQESKRYFQGLATPAAAGLVAALIWVFAKYGAAGESLSLLMMVVMVSLSLLKVSAIRYRSFKDLDLRDKVPFLAILIVVLAIVLISFDPPSVFLAVFAAYVLSGPVTTVWQMRKWRGLKHSKRVNQKNQNDE